MQKGAACDTEGAGARPMTYACIWGRARVARELLGRGIDLRYQGLGYRYSHLHACCQWGGDGMGDLDPAQYTKEILSIIGLLFEYGIDPELRNKKGKTAYQMCLANDFPERAEVIRALSEGAKKGVK